MARIITGLILIAIGVYVLGSGGLPLAIFLGLIGVLGFYEVYKFSELKSIGWFLCNSVAYIFLLSYILKGEDLRFLQLAMMGIIVLFYIVSIGEFFQKKLWFRQYSILNNLKYFSYIGMGFSSVMMLRMQLGGLVYIIVLFLSVWSCDIAALYGGKALGKHSLSKLSPKKTLEGSVVGISVAMILMLFVSIKFGFSMYYVPLAGLIAILSQFGDLYESLIKRTYDIKDSSNILPGHGGILDRGDSTLYVAPLLWIVVTYCL